MKVHIVFYRRADGAQLVHTLDYVPGQRVRDYLRAPELRRYGLVHAGLRSRLMNQHRNRLRLTSILSPDESVFLLPRGR